jgi:hypothetical protein
MMETFATHSRALERHGKHRDIVCITRGLDYRIFDACFRAKLVSDARVQRVEHAM